MTRNLRPRLRHATHQIRDASIREVALGAFAMAPGTRLAARVRDVQGNPVVGARIAATDLLDRLPHLSGSRNGHLVRCRTAATTDAQGIFVLPGAVTELSRIEVVGEGYLEQTAEPVGMGAPLDVTLRATPVVEGVVVDADGEPIAGAAVSCDCAVVATTAADGRFAFALPSEGPRLLSMECEFRFGDSGNLL